MPDGQTEWEVNFPATKQELKIAQYAHERGVCYPRCIYCKEKTMSPFAQKVSTAIAGLLAAALIQHTGLDPHTADVLSAAVASGAIGWASDHWTSWFAKKQPSAITS